MQPNVTFASKPAYRQYDMVIVGGGIVGLATARALLQKHPGLRLALLEKESSIASHQTGHNSGVIHTGIYYTPGSIKAQACVAGHKALLEFCESHAIPYELCGKVIVALSEDELPRLENLYQRGITNGVQGLELIGAERLREIEPFAVGIKAIYSPNTGIVDYVKVAYAYAQDIQAAGGEIITNCEVTGLHKYGNQTTIATHQEVIEAKAVITCAGLQCDKLSQPVSKSEKTMQIVPFRGDYFVLRPEKRHMVRGMIYPVPDPRFPFLGVHYTKRMNGEVWVGPNAVLAFAREGYGRWQIKPSELWDSLTYSGFWKLARKYWRTGAAEMYRDYIKTAYVKDARRYMPALEASDILIGPSGVRAQALGKDGALIDDFVFKREDNVIHLQNAPSPAATSSLIIAQMIVKEAEQGLVVRNLR